MRTLFFTLLALSFINTTAQEKWVLESQHLNKKDTVLIYTPSSYLPEKKYPLVYLLHGYSENYSQWGKINNLKKLADDFNMIFVCPDGFQSWYINSPYDAGSQMEDFFFNELVPKIHKSFNIDSKNIFITGLSMGGYGALRYFLLHQDYFNSAGSMSGALEIDFNLLNHASIVFFNSSRITNDLTTLIGNYKNNKWYKYDINELLTKLKNCKEFILDCGREDILYPSTLKTIKTMEKLNCPYVFISQPGNHNSKYWNKTLSFHLQYFKSKIKGN